MADWRELAARPDLEVDAVVVSTPDRQHTDPALAFLARGLPLLLEKPMAPNRRRPADRRRGRAGAACWSAWPTSCATRLTPSDQGGLDSGAIGEVVTVEHLEPVGWWHHAHSFVRGNWRREDESNPMLMAKCCHDVDWLSYIVDRPARRVSSFGSLTHFTAANKPAGAGALPGLRGRSRLPVLGAADLPRHVTTAAHGGRCPSWREGVDEEAITAALREGPYGRCVYDCDNDVVDHQVVNIEYEGGVTASLTMTAFTPMAFRKTTDLRHPRDARGRRVLPQRLRLPHRAHHLDPGDRPG